MGIYNYYSISNINQKMDEIVKHQLPLLIADERLAYNMAQRIALARGYVLYGEGDYAKQFHEYTENSKKYQEQLIRMSDSAEVKELIDKSIEWRELVIKEVFNEYDKGNRQLAIINLKEKVQPLGREVMADFEELATLREVLIVDAGDNIISNGNSILTMGLIISLLVTILGVVSGIVTSKIISKPIKLVMTRMNLLANGDLTQESLETKSQDEIGQLVKATNEATANTRDLLNQINIVSETVTSQSEELTQSANEVKAGTEQVAVTMQEMAVGSETLAENSSTLASTTGIFSSKMREANSNGEDVYDSSVRVHEMTKEGRDLMELSVKQMATIDQIVQESVQKVRGLDAQSQDISKLVSVIKDIADQTNLLALNAAIEAARAGENGRGFAVVADEVRKLAEQVSVSVTDITEIVKGIQKESATVAESLQVGYQEVAKGTNQIKTTGEMFDSINKAITVMVSNIQNITGNLTTMTADSEEMSSTIQEIAAISEESAAGIEQTSASTQQASATIEEVTKSSEDLSKLAEELNSLVRKFRV